MMAMSATLKIPVRSGPIPTFMKSITIRYVIRSRRLEAPPATKIATPTRDRLGQRLRMATTATASKSNAFPTPKTAVRTGSGQSAPRPRNAPVFSTYSSRNVSARNERLEASESVVRPHAWSHGRADGGADRDEQARSRFARGPPSIISSSGRSLTPVLTDRHDRG